MVTISKIVTFKSLREQIGLVPQETVLFNATIKENILYGRLDATDEEVYEAAKAANVLEFVEKMPDGLDTIEANEAAPYLVVSVNALLLHGLF